METLPQKTKQPKTPPPKNKQKNSQTKTKTKSCLNIRVQVFVQTSIFVLRVTYALKDGFSGNDNYFLLAQWRIWADFHGILSMGILYGLCWRCIFPEKSFLCFCHSTGTPEDRGHLKLSAQGSSKYINSIYSHKNPCDSSWLQIVIVWSTPPSP